MEVIVECIDPEDDSAARRSGAAVETDAAPLGPPRGSPPGPEGLVREPGDLALGGDPADGLRERGQAGRVGHRVHDPRRPRGELRPPVDEAHRVGGPRAKAAGVVMGPELGLVRRHVDVHRTLALAALAGEAEIERLLDLVVAPAVIELVAVHQLEEEMGPAARGMTLLTGDHVARTHDAAVVAATLADADAAERSVAERSVVVRIPEERLRPRRRVARAEAEVREDRVRPDQLAGVHPSVGIPRVLERFERADQPLAEHLRQQLAAGLAVAMLP